MSLLGLLGLVTKYVSKPIPKPRGQDIGIAIVFLIWRLDKSFKRCFHWKRLIDGRLSPRVISKNSIKSNFSRIVRNFPARICLNYGIIYFMFFKKG